MTGETAPLPLHRLVAADCTFVGAAPGCPNGQFSILSDSGAVLASPASGEKLGMATANTNLRESSITDVLSDLSQESVGLIREELRLVVADFAAQGRELGTGAGLLGGAAVLGVGAFGALTAGLIAALGRRPARGGLLVAAVYGAGAAGLADAGRKRLVQAAPQAVATVQRDVKATAKGAGRSSSTATARKPGGAKRKPAADGARRKAGAKKRGATATAGS
jgi:hypothetical protein